MHGWGLSGVRRRGAWAAVLLSALLAAIEAIPIQAFAQTRNLLPPELTSPVPVAPGTGSPGPTLAPPPMPQPSSPPQPVPMIPAGQVALAVSARYGRDAPAISGGLIWRVYAGKAEFNRRVPAPQRGQGAFADIRAAARQLCRARQPWARQHRQGRAAARRDGPRGF